VAVGVVWRVGGFVSHGMLRCLKAGFEKDANRQTKLLECGSRVQIQGMAVVSCVVARGNRIHPMREIEIPLYLTEIKYFSP